jgi:hypothetical protein
MRIVIAVLSIAVLVAASGCGSKPAYCSDKSNLQQSVKDLGNVKLTQSGGVDRLKSQLKKVESDAQQLAKSAKGDFPSQSSAIQSSVSTLKSDAQRLPNSPSPQEAAVVAGEVAAVGHAVSDFANASKSKCS